MYPYAIYAAIFFLMVSYSGAIPLMALFADSLGASYVEIGVLTAAFSVLPLMMAIHMGRLVDRYGMLFAAAAGLTGMAVSLILPVLFPVLQILYVSQMMFGAAQMVAVVALQNGAAASVPGERRERSVSNFSLAASLGTFAGPLTAGYMIDHAGHRTAYFVLACIVLLPLFFMKYERTEGGKAPRPARNDRPAASMLREAVRNPLLFAAIFISMVSMTAMDLFYVYFPLAGTSGGLSASQIGWIIALQGLAFVVVRIFLPNIITRYGHHGALYGFMAVGAVSYGLIPFFDQFYVLALLALVLGFGLGIAQPVTIMLAYNYAPKGRTAEVLGLRIASNRFAQLTLPIVLSAVSQVGGLISIFLILAAMLMAAALVARKNRSEAGNSVQFD